VVVPKEEKASAPSSSLKKEKATSGGNSDLALDCCSVIGMISTLASPRFAHQHVVKCPLNVTPGRQVYAEAKVWEASRLQRQRQAVRQGELAQELIAMMEPRLRHLPQSSFVQEEVARASEYFATRLDVFVEALIARAPQPALPPLEFVPSPPRQPSVGAEPATLCPITVVDSGTAQNPIILVSESDSDDERSRAQRRRSPSRRPNQARLRSSSRSNQASSRSASPEFGGDDEADRADFYQWVQFQLANIIASVDEALEESELASQP
jgi:hypothetical protein